MQVIVLSERISRVRTDVLVLGFFEDVRPIRGYAGEIDWFTHGAVSSLILQGKVRGLLGEVVLLATGKVPTPKILLVGLGPKKSYGYDAFEKLSAHTLQILTRLKPGESGVELWGEEACALDPLLCLDVFLKSLKDHLLQNPTSQYPFQITLLTHHGGQISEMTRRIQEHQHGWTQNAAGVAQKAQSRK